MKLSIESIFNDSGDEREKPLKHLFLSQRKWVILCASFVFLVSNGLLSINQSWLAFDFLIDAKATILLRAISFAGLLFATYMVSSAYPFYKTHRIEQRKRFDELDIEERDTFSNRISDFQDQKAELESELSERSSQISSAQYKAVDLMELIEDLRGYKDETEQIGIFEAPKSLREHLLRTVEFRNALAPSHSYTKDEIEEGIEAAHATLSKLRADLDVVRKSRDVLLKDIEQLTSEIGALERTRSKIIEANNKEWKKFYRGRIISDALSLIPTTASATYCIIFIVSSFTTQR